jgi:hypothetical protein
LYSAMAGGVAGFLTSPRLAATRGQARQNHMNCCVDLRSVPWTSYLVDHPNHERSAKIYCQNLSPLPQGGDG